MDSASVEKQTIERVERTIATLERFLSRWEESAKKPAVMIPQVAKIKRFHDALGAWQKQASRARRQDDEALRINRLRDFVLICRMYS
jgi:hypothetical protein